MKAAAEPSGLVRGERGKLVNMWDGCVESSDNAKPDSLVSGPEYLLTREAGRHSPLKTQIGMGKLEVGGSWGK